MKLTRQFLSEAKSLKPCFITVLIVMFIKLLAEAISMSDRIIVLSKRPSKVKKIYEIKFENKSTPINNRKEKEFSGYYDKIWRDLDVHI